MVSSEVESLRKQLREAQEREREERRLREDAQRGQEGKERRLREDARSKPQPHAHPLPPQPLRRIPRPLFAALTAGSSEP